MAITPLNFGSLANQPPGPAGHPKPYMVYIFLIILYLTTIQLNLFNVLFYLFEIRMV